MGGNSRLFRPVRFCCYPESGERRAGVTESRYVGWFRGVEMGGGSGWGWFENGGEKTPERDKRN